MTAELTGLPARRLAWLASGVVVVASAAIWLLVQQQNDGLNPPDPMPRALASAVLLGTPGVIGAFGVASQRRTVLVAAGILCLFQSLISFSGVTLIYLVPGIAFLRAASAGAGQPRRGPIRPRGLLLAAVVSLPIAVIVILVLGAFGALLLALIAGLLASGRPVRPRPAISRPEAARGAAVVLLVIAAWAASLMLTKTTCWVAHGVVGGELVWERIMPTDTLSLGPGIVAGTCASGTPTPLGVALGALLLAVSLVVAGAPPIHRSRSASPTA
jgi:hypothetical protein